jgi:hypothetical protein
MSLFSAFDDFLQTSVHAVPGTLGKLDYISGLRTGTAGEYVHWGLARVHGDREAQQAIAEVHRLVFSEVLSTPLVRLLEDASKYARPGDMTAYLDELQARCEAMLPLNPGMASAQHFSSVLEALLYLAQARRSTTRPTS